MQMGRHSQIAESIENVESFERRDPGNCRVFDSEGGLLFADGKKLNFSYAGRKRCLLMFKLLMRDSRVERGMPRRVAAPIGPETRPRL